MPSTRNFSRRHRKRPSHPHSDLPKGRPLLLPETGPRYHLKRLERQLQSQLNDARAAGRDIPLRRSRIGQRLRDPSVIAVGESGRRVVEHRVIKDVEKLRPELHGDSFSLDRNLLEGAHVPREHIRPAQRALTQVPRGTLEIRSKRGFVEPLQQRVRPGWTCDRLS